MNNLNKYFEDIVLNAIAIDDEFTGDSIADAVEYMLKCFINEKDWHIRQTNMITALEEWFTGLALGVPYMNHEILEAIAEHGLELDDNQQDSFLLAYFRQVGLGANRLITAYKLQQCNPLLKLV